MKQIVGFTPDVNWLVWWVAQTTAGQHPGPVTPSSTDGVPLKQSFGNLSNRSVGRERSKRYSDFSPSGFILHCHRFRLWAEVECERNKILKEKKSIQFLLFAPVHENLLAPKSHKPASRHLYFSRHWQRLLGEFQMNRRLKFLRFGGMVSPSAVPLGTARYKNALNPNLSSSRLNLRSTCCQRTLSLC